MLRRGGAHTAVSLGSLSIVMSVAARGQRMERSIDSRASLSVAGYGVQSSSAMAISERQFQLHHRVSGVSRHPSHRWASENARLLVILRSVFRLKPESRPSR